MVTLLVCTTEAADPQVARYAAAAVAANLRPRIVLTPLEGTSTCDAGLVHSVVAVQRAAAGLAAEAAEVHGVRWHAAAAVRLTYQRLLLLGRLTAAGLPVPRYASVEARSGDGLDRVLTFRFPCRVTSPWPATDLRVADVDALRELVSHRQRDATTLPPTDDTRLVVESVEDGPEFVLVGLLDDGALRVVSIVEYDDTGQDSGVGTLVVSPSSLPLGIQAHLAGAVAQGCAAVGLGQGPVLAVCRRTGQSFSLVDLWPGTLGADLAPVLTLVTPDRHPCTLEDLVVRHAVGQSLDGYAHDGVYSGLRIGARNDGAGGASLPPRTSATGSSVDEVKRRLSIQPLSGT